MRNFESLIEAQILNPEISINGLKTGMNGLYVEKSLAFGIHADSLIVSNFERTTLFTFKFEEWMIKSIEFRAYND